MSAPTVAQAIEAKRTLEQCIAAMLAEYAKDYGVEVCGVSARPVNEVAASPRYDVSVDVRIAGLTR